MNSLQDFKPEIKLFLLVALIAVVISVGGILLLKSLQPTPVAQMFQQSPTRVEPAVSQIKEESTEIQGWLSYEWGVGDIAFNYPPNWKVKEIDFGLTISPEDKSGDSYSILFGGRQVDCQSLNASRCLTFYGGFPIYTFSQNSETYEVFNSLIKTIGYNNLDAAFQILFPGTNVQLEPNKRYVIRWTTKPDIHIQDVKLGAYNASRYWQEDLVLSIENVPNTGSYEWTTPSSISSEGPYLLGISFCEPINPPPAGIIGSCKLYQGWSDPFYILASDVE